MAKRIDLTKHSKAVQIAAHAIGLDYHRPYTRHGKLFYKPYRNYYSEPTGTETCSIWENLCLTGCAKSEPSTWDEGFTFHLTRMGLDWLGNEFGITIYDEEG